jgi:hypothetical protein
MVSMNDDEKFDAWVRDAARSYNEPPASVPREEMWTVISQGTAARPKPATWRSRPFMRWAPLAAAATLLLAVGYSAGRMARTTPAPDTVASTSVPAVSADTSNPLYDAAVVSHFSRAEAMLTSFRADSAGTDASLDRWARDLLSDTRLLLDSPAANDLRRRRLLEDLELTLAQIVQLPAASSPDDQEIVDRAIERGELLTRLRNVVPRVSGT